MAETRITRDEVESAVAARQELGPEMEPAVVDAFLDKVERAVEARSAAEKAERAYRGSYADDGGTSFVLALVSLGTGIPITAIAADAGGVQGMIVAWAGIVGVNVAQRLKR